MNRINCKKCLDRGFIDTSHFRGGREYPQITLCNECKNMAAYSAEIKKRFGQTKETEQEKINRLLGRT